MRSRWLGSGLALLLLGPQASLASDGVIELNHAKALAGDSTLVPPDAPGYPIEIRSPGNYRLTSDLVVPAGTPGILIAVSSVRLDLGGFAVRGPSGCFPGSCQVSAGSGIVNHPVLGGGFQVTVQNGTVSGFREDCIQLLDGARVENVRVMHCGEYGIYLRTISIPGIPHMAFGNTISNTGSSSLVIEGGGLYRDNVLANAGLEAPSPTIVGGTATGGNLCDDGRCSKRGWRRFYLTKGSFKGDQATTACATGFHMASLWEIREPATLEYDVALGLTSADSGSGPVSSQSLDESGWIRTGTQYPFPASTPGIANCQAWTTLNYTGTIVGLNSYAWEGAARDQSPWQAMSPPCTDMHHVWCVED